MKFKFTQQKESDRVWFFHRIQKFDNWTDENTNTFLFAYIQGWFIAFWKSKKKTYFYYKGEPNSAKDFVLPHILSYRSFLVIRYEIRAHCPPEVSFGGILPSGACFWMLNSKKITFENCLSVFESGFFKKSCPTIIICVKSRRLKRGEPQKSTILIGRLNFEKKLLRHSNWLFRNGKVAIFNWKSFSCLNWFDIDI